MECCICKKPSKYKCPECSFRTCSSTCVKNHKFVYGCSGLAKPLKFIPAKDFTENNLQKDMNFLLDIARASDQSFKLVTKLSRSDNRKRFGFLLSECKNLGITLNLMPKAMSRHLNNTSLFDKQEQVIIWHVEWKVFNKSAFISCETAGNRDDWIFEGLVSKATEKLVEIPKFILDFGPGPHQFHTYFQLSKTFINSSTQSQFALINSKTTLRETLPLLSSKNPITEFPTFYLSLTPLPDFLLVKLDN